MTTSVLRGNPKAIPAPTKDNGLQVLTPLVDEFNLRNGRTRNRNLRFVTVAELQAADIVVAGEGQDPVSMSSDLKVAKQLRLRNKTLSGTIDGANKVFTTPSAFVSNTTALYQRGLRQVLGVNYTETGPKEITYAAGSQPRAGGNHVIDYDEK